MKRTKLLTTMLYLVVGFSTIGTLNSCKNEDANNPSGGGSNSYYIKHPWGGGDWTWEKMTKDGSTYVYTDVWGGVGANINTSASDDGSEWYEKANIKGASNVSIGDKVTFTFYPTNGAKGDLIVQVVSGGGDNPGGGGSETGSLPAPTNFRLSQTSSSVNLSWNRVSGASGYYVCRALPSDDQYAVIEETTSTSYTDYDVSAGTTYYYAVAAVDANGEYGDLAEKSITFNGSGSSGGGEDNPGGGGGNTEPVPSAPTNLTAEQAGPKAYAYVALSWDYNSSADHYVVYRSTSSSGTYSKIGTTYSYNYSDENIVDKKTYYYKVTAANSSGQESGFSNVASVTIDKTIVESPAPPTIKTAKASNNGTTLTITWDYVVNGAHSAPTEVTLVSDDLETVLGSYILFDWTTASSKKTAKINVGDFVANNVLYDYSMKLKVKNSAGESYVDLIWSPKNSQLYVGGSQKKYFNL